MNIGAAWKQMLTVAEQRRRQAIGLREKPGDLVQRLRDRAYAGLPDPLLEEAANEIERLRITDDEREAIKTAIDCCEDITYGEEAAPEAAAALRGLLARCAIWHQ